LPNDPASLLSLEIEQKNKKLRPNQHAPDLLTVASLVAMNFQQRALIFLIERKNKTIRNSMSSVLKNKGAEAKILRLLRAQLLVHRCVLVMSISFVIFCNIVFAQKRIKIPLIDYQGVY
jgi:hypothetical protein